MKTNVDLNPKVAKVSAKVTASSSGLGAADEVSVEIQEPPENPAEFEVPNVTEDCLVLKEEIRQLQNKVTTLKGHLSKRRSERRNQRRRGKNMDNIHAYTSTLVEKGLSKALQCTYKKY